MTSARTQRPKLVKPATEAAALAVVASIHVTVQLGALPAGGTAVQPVGEPFSFAGLTPDLLASVPQAIEERRAALQAQIDAQAGQQAPPDVDGS